MVTKMTKKHILVAALGQQPEVKEVKENWFIRGYAGNTTAGDIVGILEGSYDLGFVMKDSYQAVADFSFGNCGGGSKDLLELWKNVAATYARLDIEEQAQGQAGLAGANVRVRVG